MACGIKTLKRNDIEDIMKHNYLRKSMEQRIQRKALLDSFKRMKHSYMKNSQAKETLSSKLRSLSIQNKLKQDAISQNSRISNAYGKEVHVGARAYDEPTSL